MNKIKKYFQDIWTDTNKRMTVIMFIVASTMSTVIVDMFNKRSFVDGLFGVFENPFAFFINLSIIMFTMSVCLLFRKRMAVIAVVATVWIGLGVVNFVIMSQRVTPFSATDLILLDSIDNIIEKYLGPLSLILILIAVIIVIVFIAVLWMKLPKYADKIKYFRNVVLIVLMYLLALGSIQLGLLTGTVSKKFPNMTIAYQEYGFPFCFTMSMVSTGVSQPDEYSREMVKNIVNKMEKTTTVDEDNVITPNIIFLQLESFFDVSKMVNVETSIEVTPVFNKLKEEYPSGLLTVNNIGYGTANTEFEIMTGMNLDDFGPGEFPYKTILGTTTCESTAYLLKEYGYSTHAVHNNTATFYSRDAVFKRLGFDTFTSIEYMHPEEYTYNGWAKDGVLTEEIIKAIESTDETDYIYAISVQGHGNYPTEAVLAELSVELLGGIEDQSRAYMMEYYINQLYEMDLFIADLVAELEKLNEDVVLVMYGDHLPSLSITEDELEGMNLYQTEYVVWNNIGLEMEDKDVEAFQLSSRILEHLNIDGGCINKFHQTYAGDDDYLDKMNILSYDILYGNMFAYDGINPYVATDMTLGVEEIYIKNTDEAVAKDFDGIEDEEILSLFNESMNSITSDVPATEDDQVEDDGVIADDEIVPNWYIVSGKNFTNWSEVYVNDIQCKTVYLTPEKLLVYVDELDNLDILVVKQKSGGTVLSTSHEFTYFSITDEEPTTGEELDTEAVSE